MSVYIKGMEMPTSCDKCIYSAWSNFYQIYVCNAVRKNEPVLFDGKQTKSTAVSSARADNCPLVPVPKHGRLIDADALADVFRGFIAMYDSCPFSQLPQTDKARRDELQSALAEVINAPTIIPADKEGKEGEG